MNKKNFLTIFAFSLMMIFSSSFLIQNNIANGEEIKDVNNIENLKNEMIKENVSEFPGEFLGKAGNETENENQESCFDYYEFGSMKVDLQSERASYVPGDKIEFSGTVANTNPYPIINGEIYVRIFQDNETNAQGNGDYVIDEFFVLEDISLTPNEEKELNFDWNIPPSAFKGNYKLASFFTVGKKYNMSGLSFTSNVYAGFCAFSIRGNNQSRIIFDRNNVKFNNEQYLFRSYIPAITSKDKAEISIPLNNTYNTSKNIRVTYDLYSWDALSEENKIKSDSENIVINPNSHQNINYLLDEIDLTVYLLKITATSGTDKSIVDIRFGVNDISLARINYAGITKFPIQKGDKAKAFVCFHNTNATIFEGKINLELKDKEGNIIAFKEYQGIITGDVMVETADINANKNLNFLILESKLFDKNGKLIDSFFGTYDISELSPGYIEETSEKNKTGIYIVLFLLLIIVSAIYFLKKRKVKPVFALIFLMVGISLIFGLVENEKDAEITKAKGIPKGVGYFSQTIGPWDLNYKYGIATDPPMVSLNSPFIATSFLTVDYYIGLIQNGRILKDGDVVNPKHPIEFGFLKNGEWYGVGSSVDTPPPYWIDTELYPIYDKRTSALFKSLPGEGCASADLVAHGVQNPQFRIYAPLIIKNPDWQLNASSGANCVGNICQITGTGEIEINALIDKTYFQQIATCFSLFALSWCDIHCTANFWDLLGMKLNGAYHDKLPIEPVSKTWHLTIHGSGTTGPTAKIQCSTSDCAAFEGEIFTLLNKSTPSDDIKQSVWVVTGVGNPYSERKECNKCNFTPPGLFIGDFNVYLRVTNKDGLSDETTKDFKIKEDIEIGFKCSLDNLDWIDCSSIAALSGQEVFFKDISKPSEGASIIVRNWKFEDGNPKKNKGNNEINPSTTFTIKKEKETKEVKLYVKDSAGRNKTALENIKVFLTEEDIPEPLKWREVTPKW